MKPFDYITLGDGDFTYSLDLCRFLRAQASLKSVEEYNHEQKKIQSGDDDKNDNDDQEEKIFSVFCTGIDSRSELQAKYGDIENTLKRISSLSGKVPTLLNTNKQDYSASTMNIHLHHCVNAIHSDCPTDLKPEPTLPPGCKFKQVIFNHPHLGSEDAAKHSRFLAHFFHSASNHWLSHSGGVLHLTLVKGQYERWKCEDAAKKNGFVVLNRGSFNPPPPPGHYVDKMMMMNRTEEEDGERSCKKFKLMPFTNATKAYQNRDDYKNRFQHRRHQSGKSFASRAEGGSETITFGRKVNCGSYVATCLPWQNFQYEDLLSVKSLECPHCDKCFGDNRALKNHIKCVHTNGRTVDKATAYTCALCKGTQRIFTSEKALEAHKKAKHGKHIDVKPDWAKEECTQCPNETKKDLQSHPNDITRNTNTTTNKEEQVIISHCSVCDLKFYSVEDELKHLEEFIPVTTTNVKSKTYQCSSCSKVFHDRRAQQQHENFCQQQQYT